MKKVETEDLLKGGARTVEGLGYHVIYVPVTKQLTTRRQLALGLISVLIAEFELENIVHIKGGVSR